MIGGTNIPMKLQAPHGGTLEPSLGVYIRDTDGYFHDASAWDGTYTADSVAVITSNCSFRIALENAYSSTCQWGSYGTKVSGITTTTAKTEAVEDYDGEAQTTTILNELGNSSSNAPAAYYCRAYIFPDGSAGYLGAAGEWQAALDNKDAVDSALIACGGTAISGYYWASTQYSSDGSWFLGWTNEYLSNSDKDDSRYVRAFAAI